MRFQSTKKKNLPLIIFIIFSLLISCYLLTQIDLWEISKYLLIIPTMLMGSLVAGSSPLGGGIVAFPVMSYLLTELAELASIYSLAIQSFGMTSASIFLYIHFKDKIKFDVLKFTIPIALLTCLLSPFLKEYMALSNLKLIFASFWFGNGIILFYIKERITTTEEKRVLSKNFTEILIISAVSISGALISSIIGSGADFLLFIYLATRLGKDMKSATATSVIQMAFVSTFLTIMNFTYVASSQSILKVSHYLAYSIPVVVIFAPLGSYILTRVSKKILKNWIYFIIIAQYMTALVILELGYFDYIKSILIVTSTLLIYYIVRKVQFK